MSKVEVQKSAVISEDGMYRYRLDRWWGPGKRLVFLMMNPSTADADKDDATIRKCIGFARRWNYEGITVVNLFALRSRDPGELVTAVFPLGGDNIPTLFDVLRHEATVICAWGCESTLKAGKARLDNVRQFLMAALRLRLPGTRFMCLGHTKGGTPRHPLMLPYSTEAVDL